MALEDLLLDLNPWWREPSARPPGTRRVRRDLQPVVLDHLTQGRSRRAVALVGLRQIGKSVLLQQVAADLLDGGWPAGNLLFLDLKDDRLPVDTSLELLVEQLLPASHASDQPRIVLLDEVTSAPRWDEWVKRQIDGQSLRLALTDSSASLMSRGGRDSLLGRERVLHMEGLLFTEMLRLVGLEGETPEETFHRNPASLEQFLLLGGFPGQHVDSLPGSEARRLLRQDIAEKAVLRDLAGHATDLQRVKGLLVYLLQDSGAAFKAEERAADVRADPKTVPSWIRLLQQAALLTPLDRHGRRASDRLKGRGLTKLYASDHGLVSAFSSAAEPLRDGPTRARIHEAVVFRHLRSLVDELEQLSYARYDEKREVDFVLAGADGPIAIEVTSTRQPRTERLEKLRAAADRLGAERRVLIHGGIAATQQGDVTLLPLHRFLLDPSLVLPREAAS